MDALSLAGFLLIGFTGSLHCAGMCGPIVWLMPFQHLQGFRRWLAILLYHAGRIGAYCVMGAVFVSLRGLFDPGWQQRVAVISGALLTIFGILSFFGNRGSGWLRPLSGLIIAVLSRVSGRRAIGYLGLAGFLNGLLPCGMVYMALGLSMKSSGMIHGVTGMAAFGAGTMPMLLAVTMLRRRIRVTGLRWANTAVVAIGLIVMLRGANLGIPFLSPERAAVILKDSPKLDCCHRPK